MVYPINEMKLVFPQTSVIFSSG